MFPAGASDHGNLKGGERSSPFLLYGAHATFSVGRFTGMVAFRTELPWARGSICTRSKRWFGGGKVKRDMDLIERTPEERGVKGRIAGTKIGVHGVIQLLVDGETEESLAEFLGVTREQVEACKVYYWEHKKEIDFINWSMTNREYELKRIS